MLRSLVLLLAQSLLFDLVSCDVGLHAGDDLHSFVTRPDLKSPKWNVKYHDRDKVAPGYWFVNPYNLRDNNLHDIKWTPCEVGPMIYDNEGELVWSGACQFPNHIVFDFTVSEFYDDEGMALTGTMQHANFPEHDVGTGWFLGSNYDVKHSVIIDSRNRYFDLHEFNVYEGGKKALVPMRGPVKWPGHDLGLEEDIWIELSGFQELDVETGNVVFEWQAQNYIGLDESSYDPSEHGRPGLLKFNTERSWDLYHINSIDKNEDGDFLVSIRHTDTLVLVSGKDGHVIWRAGGMKSDFVLEDGLVWSRQHHARYMSYDKDRSVISLLDNAAPIPTIDSQPPTHPFSRGLIIELNHKEGEEKTARVLQHFDRPDGNLATKRGSMQVLPNKNVFLAWTDAGYLSEHTEDGKVVMEASFMQEERLGTYRAYKHANWVGKPKESPVVKAISYGVGSNYMTAFYVSWNGATEVRTWNFYSDGAFIGSTNKTGFETAFVSEIRTGEVWVEGLDRDGTVLGQSGKTQTETPMGWDPYGATGSSKISKTYQRARYAAQSHPYYLAAILAMPACFGCFVLFRMFIRRRVFSGFSMRRPRGGYESVPKSEA